MGTKTLKSLKEMAVNIGNSSYSPLQNKVGNSVQKYRMTSHHPVVGEMGHGVKLHRLNTPHSNGNDWYTHHTTNDHTTGRTLHQATFEVKDPDSNFPYKTESQISVDRVKDTTKLPKGHATDIAYEHFSGSKHPLRSSNEQFRKGHEMWHRLVDKALRDNHHVYHWDGTTLHKTTHSNKEEHLSNSFGKDQEFANKHMILSKKSLKDD